MTRPKVHARLGYVRWTVVLALILLPVIKMLPMTMGGLLLHEHDGMGLHAHPLTAGHDVPDAAAHARAHSRAPGAMHGVQEPGHSLAASDGIQIVLDVSTPFTHSFPGRVDPHELLSRPVSQLISAAASFAPPGCLTSRDGLPTSTPRHRCARIDLLLLTSHALLL